MEETLVPLDLSDERQKEQIAELKADIERLTALAYERQEIIKEQVEEISKREHGWKLLYKEKDKQIAELKARVSELEGALRLCLAVSPDDPLIITPAEKEIVILREQISELIESRDEWKRQWRLMEAAEKKAEEQIVALKVEKAKEFFTCASLMGEKNKEVAALREDYNRTVDERDNAYFEIEQLKFGREALLCPRTDK